MKTVFVALLVVFAVSHSELPPLLSCDNFCPELFNEVTVFVSGEALQCNCGGSKYCPRPIETCLGATDVCASVIIFAGTREWCSSFLNCPQKKLVNVREI